MKVLSSGTVYAIRALVYLLNHSGQDRHVSIREITEELDISFHFLTKTFQELTKAGILISYRGPSGGISFAKDPSEISMIDVINVLEGDKFFNSCLLGLPGCGHDEPCPTHEMWSAFRDDLAEKFETTSLSELHKMEGRIAV